MNGYDLTFELAYRAILAQSEEERGKNEHDTDDTAMRHVARNRHTDRQKNDTK